MYMYHTHFELCNNILSKTNSLNSRPFKMIKIIFLTVSDFPISNFRMELDCGLEYYSILEQKKIFVEGFFGKVVLKIQ